MKKFHDKFICKDGLKLNYEKYVILLWSKSYNIIYIGIIYSYGWQNQVINIFKENFLYLLSSKYLRWFRKGLEQMTNSAIFFLHVYVCWAFSLNMKGSLISINNHFWSSLTLNWVSFTFSNTDQNVISWEKKLLNFPCEWWTC